MSDPLDGAIKAADGKQLVQMAQTQGHLATGRPFAMTMPADATEFEFACLMRALLDFRDKLMAHQQASAKVVGLDGRRLV